MMDEFEFEWNIGICQYALCSITSILSDVDSGATKLDKETIACLHYYQAKILEGKLLGLFRVKK